MAGRAFELAKTIKDERGGVAIIFALSLAVLAICAGLAIDYARTTSTASVLQADVDATLLFVGRAKQSANGNNYDVQQAAQNYLAGLRRQKHAGGSRSVISVSEPSPGKLKAYASVSVPTTFAKIMGYTSLPVKVMSEIAVGDQPVEVALVLDNTASMQGAKLAALKQAAKSLIDTAYLADRSEFNVQLGLVPFAQYVNVGTASRNASWISVPQDSSTAQAEVCYQDTPVTGKSNCYTETRTALNDGVPYTYTVETCDYQYGPPVQVCYTPVVSYMWYGCVGSRNYPLETLDGQYDTPIPGIMNVSCSSQISPLTNDKAALEQQIDEMVATGETYLPSGLIWGWRILSKEAPYEEAKGYTELVNGQTVRKFIVLMSDGENTLSPVYPEHTGTDKLLADGLTQEVCSNIKAKGIEIYAVAFEVPNAAAKQVLQDCASGASKFFDAADGQQLDEAFRKIALDFSPLRLTR